MEKENNNINKEDNISNSKKNAHFFVNYNYNISLVNKNNQNESKIEKIEIQNNKFKKEIRQLKKEESVDQEKIDELNNKIKENQKNIKNLEEEIRENDGLINLQDKTLDEDAFIEIKDLVKSYSNNEVLKGLNLKIKRGERYAIIGTNGAGKSTFIEILSGIKKANSGTINYNFAFSKDNLGQNMAVQFQNIHFPEGYKVKEVINFFYKMVPSEKSYSKEEFKKLLDDFGISHFYKKSLVSLSGGQQQRINLFLTFIKKPSLLILDELSAGLDVDIYDKIVNLFMDYIQKNNVTTLIISHNFKEIKFFTQKAVLLKDGKFDEILPVDSLTESKFFELIKRDKKANIDFKFDFNRGSEIKDNILVSYFKFFRNIYKYWKFSKEEMEENLSQTKSKINDLTKKLDIAMNDANVVNEVYKEMKEENSNYKKVKKLFVEKLKDQEKIQSQIDKYESKIDNYKYILSDEFALERIKFTNFFNAKKINRLEKKYNSLNKKKENSKDKKVEKLEKLIEEKKNKLDIAKKEFSHKLEETKKLTKKIESDKLNFQKFHIDKIKIINLKKYFGIKPALDGINLTIKKGERVAITGPNGSGKTTFAEILSTTNDKTIGKIKYWFKYKNKEKVKHEIGMQFQEAIFPYDLKVREILDLFVKVSMWSINKDELNQLIKIFRIEDILEQKGDVLSGGERQKLNVLIALLKKPSILILDEISTGLDIESVLDINNYIKKYLDDTKATLILISHNAGEAFRLAEKVIILKDGVVSNEIDIRKKSKEQIEKIFKDVYTEKGVLEGVIKA